MAATTSSGSTRPRRSTPTSVTSVAGRRVPHRRVLHRRHHHVAAPLARPPHGGGDGLGGPAGEHDLPRTGRRAGPPPGRGRPRPTARATRPSVCTRPGSAAPDSHGQHGLDHLRPGRRRGGVVEVVAAHADGQTSGDADGVALGAGRRGLGHGVAVEARQHALDDAPVDGADHRVLHRGLAERALLGDDGQRRPRGTGCGRRSRGRSGRRPPCAGPPAATGGPRRGPWRRPATARRPAPTSSAMASAASRGTRARVRARRVTSRSSRRAGNSRRMSLATVR